MAQQSGMTRGGPSRSGRGPAGSSSAIIPLGYHFVLRWRRLDMKNKKNIYGKEEKGRWHPAGSGVSPSVVVISLDCKDQNFINWATRLLAFSFFNQQYLSVGPSRTGQSQMKIPGITHSTKVTLLIQPSFLLNESLARLKCNQFLDGWAEMKLCRTRRRRAQQSSVDTLGALHRSAAHGWKSSNLYVQRPINKRRHALSHTHDNK